ncbi:hypothetical protein, partial [Streptomyces sp. NPDC088731]|uniref:hypothetical protein n=1 Tax=Streptomyces sp. NPDC088731 TaxID=3365878 RepID=UPI0038006889
MIIGRHTDQQGRSTGERISAVPRAGRPLTDAEQAAATRLLDSMLDAASDHGVTLDAIDLSADLPTICLEVAQR